MDNLKIYQICHNLIDYFATLTSPKKSHLGPIFRTGIVYVENFSTKQDKKLKRTANRNHDKNENDS